MMERILTGIAWFFVVVLAICWITGVFIMIGQLVRGGWSSLIGFVLTAAGVWAIWYLLEKGKL